MKKNVLKKGESFKIYDKKKTKNFCLFLLTMCELRELAGLQELAVEPKRIEQTLKCGFNCRLTIRVNTKEI